MRHPALGYALTGGVAALVDLGGFHWLAPRMESILLAAALSFCAAAVVNYLLSSRWVFRRDWRSCRRAALFAAAACAGLSINAGMTWALASAWPLHATLAKAGGIGVAFTANYLMNRHWVFGRGRPAQASP